MLYSFAVQSLTSDNPSKIEEKCRSLENTLEAKLQTAIAALTQADMQPLYRDIHAQIIALLNDYNQKMAHLHLEKLSQNTSNSFHHSADQLFALEQSAYLSLKALQKEVEIVLNHFNHSLPKRSADELISSKIQALKNRISQLAVKKMSATDPNKREKLENKATKIQLKLEKLQKKLDSLTVNGRLKNTINPLSYSEIFAQQYQYFFTSEIETASLNKIDNKINKINQQISLLQKKIKELNSQSLESSLKYKRLQAKEEVLANKLQQWIAKKADAEQLQSRGVLGKIRDCIVNKVSSKLTQTASNIDLALSSTLLMYQKTSYYMLGIPLVIVELENMIGKNAYEINEMKSEIDFAQKNSTSDVAAFYMVSNQECLTILEKIDTELRSLKQLLRNQIKNKIDPVLSLSRVAVDLERQINQVKFNNSQRQDLTGTKDIHLIYLQQKLNIINRIIQQLSSPLTSEENSLFYNEVQDSYANNISRLLKLSEALLEEPDENLNSQEISDTSPNELSSEIEKISAFYTDEIIKHHGLDIQKHFEVIKPSQKMVKGIGKTLAGSSFYVLFGEQGEVKLQKAVDKLGLQHPLSSEARARANRIYEEMDLKEKLFVETFSVAGSHVSNKAIDYAALTFAGSAIITGGASFLPAVVGVGLSLIAKGAVGYLKSNVEDIVKESIKSTYVSWRYSGISEYDFAHKKVNEQLDKLRLAMLELDASTWSPIEKDLRKSLLIQNILLLEIKAYDITIEASTKKNEQTNAAIAEVEKKIIALNKLTLPDHTKKNQLQSLQVQKNELLTNQEERTHFIALMKLQKKLKANEIKFTDCQMKKLIIQNSHFTDIEKQIAIQSYDNQINQLNINMNNLLSQYQLLCIRCLPQERAVKPDDNPSKKRKAALVSAFAVTQEDREHHKKIRQEESVKENEFQNAALKKPS